jgi:hypothetical protein
MTWYFKNNLKYYVSILHFYIAKCSSVTRGQQFPLWLVHLMMASCAETHSARIAGDDEFFGSVNLTHQL